ncbi:MAG: DUF1028 domain-containing protein [Acidobacteria bacterium]|nr:DUF1028 domain-containing protein [Acidobacteriota bacterium]
MLLLCLLLFQNPQSPVLRPVHTYSIVAIDTERGEMGVAVQSHWFSVGSVVPWAQSGVGVVATQSLVEPAYGYRGLQLMADGLSAEQALAKIKAEDPNPGVRQVAMIDAKGGVAAFTGDKCIAEAGFQTGKTYSVQANIMEKATVWPAMANAFEKSSGPLAERLLTTLKAAQAEGGDLRGQQSAAILVVKIKSSGSPWKDKVVDLRVEDHADPLGEMSRLLKVANAYHHMDEGDECIGRGDMAGAQKAYNQALELMPAQAEIAFWAAATMVTANKESEGLALFKKAFALDPKLVELVPRLVAVDLFPNDPELLEKVKATAKNP